MVVPGVGVLGLRGRGVASWRKKAAMLLNSLRAEVGEDWGNMAESWLSWGVGWVL